MLRRLELIQKWAQSGGDLPKQSANVNYNCKSKLKQQRQRRRQQQLLIACCQTSTLLFAYATSNDDHYSQWEDCVDDNAY